MECGVQARIAVQETAERPQTGILLESYGKPEPGFWKEPLPSVPPTGLHPTPAGWGAPRGHSEPITPSAPPAQSVGGLFLTATDFKAL